MLLAIVRTLPDLIESKMGWLSHHHGITSPGKKAISAPYINKRNTGRESDLATPEGGWNGRSWTLPSKSDGPNR